MNPPKMYTMHREWRLARFDEFLRKVDRKFILDDTATYKCVGVRWYGMGAFVREIQLGASISRKQQWAIRRGDVVYNKLFAWKGAFAIANEGVDGCIVSDKFPTYEIDPTQIDPRYLGHYFRTPQVAQQAQDLSKGAAAISKLTLNPPQFWDLKIPLPPLDEQRRIVARIEALAAKIEEARGLRREAFVETEMLLKSQVSATFQRLTSEIGSRSLEDLILDGGYGTSIKCCNERTRDAVPVLRIPNVASERVNFSDLKHAALTADEMQRVRVDTGDILIVRTNGSSELVGRCAVVPELNEPMAFASYLIRLRCDTQLIDPAYLQLMLKHLRTDGQLIDFARTTAGQYNVSLGRLRAAQMPVPPRTEQRRIVAYLDGLQAKVDALQKLQAETAAELDALLPSILDKAFKGEL